MDHLCSGPTCERTTGARRCSSVGARGAPFSQPAGPGSGTTTGPTTGAQQTPPSSALCAPSPRPARRLLPRFAGYYCFWSPRSGLRDHHRTQGGHHRRPAQVPSVPLHHAQVLAGYYYFWSRRFSVLFIIHGITTESN
jgi:hypothetical protein